MPVLFANDQKLNSIPLKILHMKSKSSLPVSTYSVFNFNFLSLFVTESLSKFVQKQSQTVGKGWTRPWKRRECDVTYLTLAPVHKTHMYTVLHRRVKRLNDAVVLSVFFFSTPTRHLRKRSTTNPTTTTTMRTLKFSQHLQAPVNWENLL